MTIVAGIDEAGYGPTLGPLVVAASAFRLDEGVPERDLNRLVQLKTDQGGLAIKDSKQLYTTKHAFEKLETSMLGHVALARDSLPLRMSALLAGTVDFTPAEIRRLPWYGDALLDMTLPRQADVHDILERARRQEELLEDRGIELAEVFVAVVPEPRFNRLTTAAGSKAWTLFYATGRLIEALVAAFPDEELIIHCDRHGGRTHYGQLLQTFFPLAPLSTVSERKPESVYTLDWPGRGHVRIDFKVKADGSRTPVALASVAAKTVRELFMESLNAWFARRQPDLKATAGYHTDAHRFLEEVSGKVSADQRALLVRCR